MCPSESDISKNLYRLTKVGDEIRRDALRATLFVPMTGLAEERRQRLPDPVRPSITNGSFEETVGEKKRQPVGWHYLRQAVVADSDNAPDGRRYLTFSNSEPGRASRALQGLAIDGRKIARLELSAHVQGHDLAAGPTPDQVAAAMVTFYDTRRSVIGNHVVAAWKGTFPVAAPWLGKYPYRCRPGRRLSGLDSTGRQGG